MHRRGLVLSGAGTTETEFAYRPDDTDWFDDYPLDFRNGEIFQVFVCAFWGHENDSLLIDTDTVKGSLALAKTVRRSVSFPLGRAPVHDWQRIAQRLAPARELFVGYRIWHRADARRLAVCPGVW